jgi:hypothetical protein
LKGQEEMAIATIGFLPGANAQTDDAMRQQLGVTPETPPKGVMARMAGPVEGGWRIITVWDSQGSWEDFRRDRLEPMFRQMGQTMPTVEVAQLETFFIAPGAQNQA